MLVLPKPLAEELVAHCRRQYPKEACGVLAGQQGRITRLYPMRNVEDSPIGYSMDPKEQLQVEKAMRQAGQQMVGVYHSHTASEAYPSSVDVSLAISPDISYVLVSLKKPDAPVIKSYRIEDSRVLAEELRLD